MTITLVGAGAWASGTTDGSPAASYPAVTIEAGDLAVYELNFHESDNTEDTNASENGWTRQIAQGGNTQSPGTDTGPCQVAFFTKEMVGGESGSTNGEINIVNNVTGTQGTSASGRILVFRRSAGDSWDIAAVGGTDDTTGTDWSIAFGSDPGLDAGDVIVYGNCLPTDTNPTYGSESVAATGATIGAVNDEAELSIAAGRDCGGKGGWRSVTAGPSSAAPTWTATLSGTTTNASGPAAMLRLREGSSSVTGDVAVTLPALTAEVDGTVTVDGAVAATLPALAADADGVVEVAGAAAVTLPALAADADGVVEVAGPIAAALPALAVEVDGAVTVDGPLAVTLPALVVAADGSVAGGPVSGELLATLPALTADADGTVRVDGVVAAVLPALTVGADGTVRVEGAVAVTLPALTVDASGARPAKATSVATVSASATSSPVVSASATSSPVVSASATSSPVVSASRTSVAAVAAAAASSPTVEG